MVYAEARSSYSKENYASLPRILLLAHCKIVLCIITASYISYVITIHSFIMLRSYMVATIYVALLAWVVFYYFGLLSKEVLFSRRLYWRRITLAWLLVVAITLSLALTFDIAGHFSSAWARSWFLLSLAVFVVERGCFMRLAHRWKAEGLIQRRAIVLGAGENTCRLVSHFKDLDGIPTVILGCVDDRRADRHPLDASLPRLGTTHDLVGLIRTNQVDMVIVALPLSAARRVGELVRRFSAFPVDILLAPELATFEFPSCQLEHVGGVPMLRVFERPISGWAQAAKRVEDIVVASACFVLLAPVMALAALAVLLTSDGPIFFRQKRYGYNNSIINVLKFRTMYVTASDLNGTTQAVRKDPRVTRVGCILRRTSIDELPQLFNVLKGEMSIVGPRPHALGTRTAGRLFEDVVDEYAARHRVKPGITGWAQINGLRGETDTFDKLKRRIEHDLYYIEHWSLWLDFVIIAKTLPCLFSNNAY